MSISLAPQCIELMGDGCLNNEHFEELGGILKGKLEEHFKNQELRQGDPRSVKVHRTCAHALFTDVFCLLQPNGRMKITTNR